MFKLKNIHINVWDLLIVLIFPLITSCIFKTLLASPGTIGIRSDWPIPPLEEQLINQVKGDVFHVWSENYLGYERQRQTGNYVDLATYLAVKYLHFDGNEISKYPLVVTMFIGPVCYLILRKLKIKPFFAFIGAGFYAYCVPFLYDSIINGYLKFTFSYLFFPIFYYYLYKIFNSSRTGFSDVVYFTAAYAMVSTAINFFVIGFIVILFFALYYLLELRSPTYTIRKLILVTLGVVIVILIQATTFLIPIYTTIFLKGSESINMLGDGLIAFLTYSHPNSINASRLFGVVDNYFESGYPAREYPLYIYKTIAFSTYSLFLFSLVLTGLFFRKSERFIKITVIVVICGLFILKGVNDPYGYINRLFYLIPFMAVLRNISYITLILGFGYAVLISSSLNHFYIRFRRNRLISCIPASIGVFLLVMGTYPLWYTDIMGKLRGYSVSDAETKIFRNIYAQKQDFNIINVPFVSPFIYTDRNGDKIGPGFNPFVTNPPKPSLLTSVNKSVESHYAAANIYNTMTYDNFPEFSPLLNILNIKYVIHDTNFESVYPSFIILGKNKWYKSLTSNYSVENALERSDLLKSEINIRDNVRVYETSGYRNSPILITDGLALNIGDFSNYNIQSKVFDKQLNGVFSEDYTEELDRFIKYVHFHNTEYTDLVMKIIPPQYKYQPGNLLDRNRNAPTKEWSPIYHGQYWWYDPILSQTEESVILLKPDKEADFNIPFNVKKGVTYKIFGKFLFSTEGSPITFRIDGEDFSEIDTRTERNKYFKYVLIGEYISDSDRKSLLNFVTSEGRINVASEFTIIPEEIQRKAEEKARNLITQNPILLSYTLNNINGLITESVHTSFYYSKVIEEAREKILEINVPKSGEYEIGLEKDPATHMIDEYLNSSYFETIGKGKSIERYINVDESFSDVELCLSYTYINPEKNVPSLRPPEKPLSIQINDISDNRTLLKKEINPQHVYSEGDWLYVCTKNKLDGQRKAHRYSLVLSSEAKNTLWAFPVDTFSKQEPHPIKFRLIGYRPNEELRLDTDINGVKIPVKLKEDYHVTYVAKLKLNEGPNIIHLTCRSTCDLNTLILKGLPNADISDTVDTVPNYIKYSPEKYEVEKGVVNNSDDVSLLIFKQTYDNSWLLNKQGTGKHFVVNGFQNAWVLNAEDSQDNITINYSKKKLYDFANTVSFIAMGVMVALVLLTPLIRGVNKNDENN